MKDSISDSEEDIKPKPAVKRKAVVLSDNDGDDDVKPVTKKVATPATKKSVSKVPTPKRKSKGKGKAQDDDFVSFVRLTRIDRLLCGLDGR